MLIYKRKGDSLNTKGNFTRSIKLLEYGFYLYGQILKRKPREIVDIGFMTSRATGDAVFILRRLTEKYWSKGKKLFYCSIYIYIYIYIYTPRH